MAWAKPSHTRTNSTMTNRTSSRVVFFFACFLCVGSGSGFSVSVHRSRDGVGPLSHSTRAPSTRSRCFTTLQSTDRGENKVKTRVVGAVNIHARNEDLIHSGRRRVRLLANQSDNTDDDEMEIIMGLGDDTISDKAWEDIEAGAPSEAAIMKEVGKYRSGSWALFRVKFTIPPRTKHFLLFIQISVQQTQLFLIKPIFRCDFQSLSIAHVPASMYDIYTAFGMMQLLGINIFTYILGAACIFFLSMNAILGPGWLGQVAGIQGTGSFTDVSDSLPGNVDLNNPENLLF